jgi:hypothetical protein
MNSELRVIKPMDSVTSESVFPRNISDVKVIINNGI